MHFDEKSMFAGDKKGAKSLKVKLVFWMTSKIPILELGCVTLESPSAYHKHTAESKILFLPFLELYMMPFNQLKGSVLIQEGWNLWLCALSLASGLWWGAWVLPVNAAVLVFK